MSGVIILPKLSDAPSVLPAANKCAIYIKDDESVYIIDSDGNESKVGPDDFPGFQFVSNQAQLEAASSSFVDGQTGIIYCTQIINCVDLNLGGEGKVDIYGAPITIAGDSNAFVTSIANGATRRFYNDFGTDPQAETPATLNIQTEFVCKFRNVLLPVPLVLAGSGNLIYQRVDEFNHFSGGANIPVHKNWDSTASGNFSISVSSEKEFLDALADPNITNVRIGVFRLVVNASVIPLAFNPKLIFGGKVAFVSSTVDFQESSEGPYEIFDHSAGFEFTANASITIGVNSQINLGNVFASGDLDILQGALLYERNVLGYAMNPLSGGSVTRLYWKNTNDAVVPVRTEAEYLEAILNSENHNIQIDSGGLPSLEITASSIPVAPGVKNITGSDLYFSSSSVNFSAISGNFELKYFDTTVEFDPSATIDVDSGGTLFLTNTRTTVGLSVSTGNFVYEKDRGSGNINAISGGTVTQDFWHNTATPSGGGGLTFSSNFPVGLVGAESPFSGGQLFANRFIPETDMTITKLSCLVTSASAGAFCNYQLAIYDNIGSGNLLRSGSISTNPSVGINSTPSFTPLNLTAGVSYWLGVLGLLPASGGIRLGRGPSGGSFLQSNKLISGNTSLPSTLAGGTATSLRFWIGVQ